MTTVDELVRALGVGIKNAKHGDVLVSQLELPGAGGLPGQLRWLVNQAAADSIPVCSGREGYWLAGTQDEIEATLAHRRSRVRKQNEAIAGLELARPTAAAV
jgi:hypothetical protein